MNLDDDCDCERALKKSLAEMVELYDHLLEVVDWGKTALSADLISEMNTTPMKARELLNEEDH